MRREIWILLVLAVFGALYFGLHTVKNFTGGYWNFQMEDLSRAYYARDIVLQNGTGQEVYASYVDINIPKSDLWNVSDLNRLRFTYVTDKTLILPCRGHGCASVVYRLYLTGECTAQCVDSIGYYGFVSYDFDGDGNYELLVYRRLEDHTFEKNTLELYSQYYPIVEFAASGPRYDGKFYVLAMDASKDGTVRQYALYLLDVNAYTLTRLYTVPFSGKVYDAFSRNNIFYVADSNGTQYLLYTYDPSSNRLQVVRRYDLSSFGCQYILDMSFVDRNEDVVSGICLGSGKLYGFWVDFSKGEYYSRLLTSGVYRGYAFGSAYNGVVSAYYRTTSGYAGYFLMYDMELNRFVVSPMRPFGSYGYEYGQRVTVLEFAPGRYVSYVAYHYSYYTDFHAMFVAYYDRSTGEASYTTYRVNNCCGYASLSYLPRHVDYYFDRPHDYSVLPVVRFYYLGRDWYTFILGTYGFVIPRDRPFILPYTARDCGDKVCVHLFVPYIPKDGTAVIRVYYGDFPNRYTEYNRWIYFNRFTTITSGITYTFGATYTGSRIDVTYPAKVYVFSPIDLNVTLTDASGSPLSGRTLTLYINGEENSTCTTSDQGKCTFSVEFDRRGRYYFRVVFSGDGTYLGSEDEFNLYVSGLPVNMSVSAPSYVDVNVPFTVGVSLSTDYEYNLTGSIVIELNGTTIYSGEYNGEPVSVEVNGLSEGVYPLVVAYSGSDVYEPALVEKNIYVGVAPPSTGGGSAGGGVSVGGFAPAAPQEQQQPQQASAPPVQPASATTSGVKGSTVLVALIALAVVGYLISRRL